MSTPSSAVKTLPLVVNCFERLDATIASPAAPSLGARGSMAGASRSTSLDPNAPSRVSALLCQRHSVIEDSPVLRSVGDRGPALVDGIEDLGGHDVLGL